MDKNSLAGGEVLWEGLQTIDTLIDNMEYVIKGLNNSEKPEKRKYKHTNFIK